jgi:hypothetical protein
MSRLWVLSVLALLATPAIAQQQDTPLGRLFLTPEQRATLDNARRNKIRAEAVAGAVVKTPKPPAARSVLINGVVKRSDGETIVWVNGKPIESETPDGMQFQVAPQTQGGTVLVREPEKGRRVEIKVGQQVDMLTGRIKEPFERPPSTAPAPKTAPPARSSMSTPARLPKSEPDKVPSEDTAPAGSAPATDKPQQ